LKSIFKLIKIKLFLLLLIFYEIHHSSNQLKAQNFDIKIRGSNIDFVIRILKKADKRNSPKMITNPDSSKSIIYKKSNFQKKLSQKELIYLIKNPQNFNQEQNFVEKALKFLDQLGISVFLLELSDEKGSAYWLPEKQIIKIDSKTLNAGTLTFAKILNHEMIHIAQSCKGGSINAFPKLIGLNEKLNEEKNHLLSSEVYKNLPKSQISLEKEAYSYQDNLSAGKYLINKYCD
jgi:hypothetical protein